MNFLIIKSLHIIFVVTWFAGLFYGFRLFVYFSESDNKDEPERSILQKQYLIMIKRLWYIITLPSGILATIFGTWLIFLNTSFIYQPYMHIKLFFVLLLWAYNEFGLRIAKQLSKGIVKYSSQRLRLLNEVPTIILIAIVFLVVVKDQLSWIWGVLGIVGLALLLTIVVRLYKKRRDRKES